MASRLQKCFRRGSESSSVLYSTIKKLSVGSPYCLPDMQYARVSANRQLFWRSFISIIEDVCGYESNKIYDLLDFFILAYICHINPDLQIKKKFMLQIQESLLNIQNVDKVWKWCSGTEKEYKLDSLSCEKDSKSRIIDSMILALNCMPSMSGDKKMLSKCINYLIVYEYKLYKISHHKATYYLEMNNNEIEKDVLLSSMDMHCNPSIILLLQGSIPFIPTNKYSTTDISGYIWDLSSKKNFRIKEEEKLTVKEKMFFDTLREIQSSYMKDIKLNIKDIELEEDTENEIIIDEEIDDNTSRVGFIKLFGQKVKLSSPNVDVIVCGTVEEPLKIKKATKDKYFYLEGKEKFDNELKYIKLMEKGIKITLPQPPFGYKWNVKNPLLKAKLINSDKKLFKNEIEFEIDDISISPFDSKPFLIPIGKYEEIKLNDEELINIIDNAIYLKNTISGYKLNLLMRHIGNKRNDINDNRVFKLKKLLFNEKLIDVYKKLYVKTQMNNVVEIGPVLEEVKKHLMQSIIYLKAFIID